MFERANRPNKFRRGIYLPNLITTLSLLCGFYAAISAFGVNFKTAAIAIVVCVVLDGLDGNIARWTNTASRFGSELDSLTDAVVFGCIPALIVYQWSLHILVELGSVWGKIGWLIAFAYVAATVLRLARFNSQAMSASKNFFRGLPCPVAAILMMSLIWACEDLGYAGEQLVWSVVMLMVLVSITMVSNFSYFSLKGIQWKGRISFVVLALLIGVLMLSTIDAPKFLFFLALLYLLSGPAIYLKRVFKRSSLLSGKARSRPPR